jgi:Zn-dependent M28 family amino/carboxypeptidase
MALSRGALGSCLIAEIQGDTTLSWEKLRREFSFEDVTLAYSVSGHLSVLLNPRAAALLFEDCQYSMSDVLLKAAKHEIKSFPLHRSISFAGEFIERDFTAKNVIGLIRGSDQDLRENYLLISAHYDHLGVGPILLGDSIYNGVMDNAAGVAASLEIGRILSKHRDNLKRSTILLFSTGEEKGLLGAKYYVDHPTFPLYKTITNINIDGLAMFDTFHDVVAIGAELSDLGKFLHEALAKQPFKYIPTPEIIEKSESFSRSDQFAFANGGIPSMLIMEGFHWDNYSPEQAVQKFQTWMNFIYHSPFDDINQPINYFAALNHSQIILSTAYYILNQENVPEWIPSVKYHTIRLQTMAEKR